MGYRSEVRCLIYGTKDDMDAFLTEQSLIVGDSALKDPIINRAVTLYAIEQRVNADGTNVTKEFYILDFHVSDWKWYNDYPLVKAWYKFMDEAEESGLQYEFLRLGEDRADIEETQSDDPQYFLYVDRWIGEDFIKGEPIPLNL